jgi:hypothetical protein
LETPGEHLQEDVWEQMKSESNEDRWLRLQETHDLSENPDPEADKSIRRSRTAAVNASLRIGRRRTRSTACSVTRRCD